MQTTKPRSRSNKRSVTTPGPHVAEKTSSSHQRIHTSANNSLGAHYASGPAVSLSPVQAKFTIGKANDPYEQEADAVAEHVVSGKQAPNITPVPAAGLGSVAQMEQGAEEPEEEPPQTQLIQREETAETEEEQPPQTQLLQRQTEKEPEEETPLQPRLIQREKNTETEEEPPQTQLLQRQSEEEPEEGPPQTKQIQRQTEEKAEEEPPPQPQLIQREENAETEEEPPQTQLLQRQAEEEPLEESPQTKLIQREENTETEEEPPQTQLIQRQAEEEPEEEPPQTKLIQRQQDEEEKPVQKQFAGASSGGNRKTAGMVARLKAPGVGRPLPASTRREMEAGLGTDFSAVRIHDTSADQVEAARLNARAFTYGNHIWLGSGASTGDRRLMAHELTHTVQQGATDQGSRGAISMPQRLGVGVSGGVIQREGPDDDEPTNLERLDEMLDRFDVPENDVITLLGQLSSGEARTVLAGGYRDRIASALNVGEMVRAVTNLNPELRVALEWVRASVSVSVSVEVDYTDIQSLVISAPQGQRDALKTTAWRNFFVDVCTNTTMFTAVRDLGFDLETQLQWIRAEMTWTRAELSYNQIQSLITAAPQTERDALKTEAWRDFFVEVCTNATMFTAVGDLAFDLETQLQWIQAEMSWTRAELDYSQIQSLITAAPQPQRDALKTAGWRDFFVEVCTNETMFTAVGDLAFDLETKLQWIQAEMTLTRAELDYSQIQPMITAATQGERDALNTAGWRDFFVEVCTDETIITAANDLGFPFDGGLALIQAEGVLFEIVFEWTMSQVPAAGEVVNLIHTATTDERQTVLDSATLRALVTSTYSGDDAVLIMSALLEGSQQWQNPPGNDFYRYFVVNGGVGTLPNTDTMNCWESIMYAAYLAGEVDVAWINSFYSTAMAAPDATAEVWNQLGFHAGLPQYPANTPSAGQLVFYMSGGATIPGHVVLSLGGDEAMSLWDRPHANNFTQRIQLSDLPGNKYIGDAPW